MKTVFLLSCAMTFLATTSWAEEADQVKVTIRSDDPDAMLFRLRSAGGGMVGGYSFVMENWESICTAPCEKSVDANAVYQVAGKGVTPSDTFNIEKSNELQLNVDAGSRTVRFLGWASFWTGIAAAGMGGVFLLLASTEDESLPGASERADTVSTMGAVSLASGAGLIGLGIPLIAISGTTVKDGNGREIAKNLPSKSGAQVSATFAF